MGKEENTYIPKEVYKKTEGALYGYFKDKKEMLNIESEIRLLEKNIAEIESDIKNTNVKIDYYQNGSGISERVQTSSAGISYAEQEICAAIDKLEKEHAMKIRRLVKQKKRYRKMEEQNNRMKDNIEQLEKDLQLILKYRYCNKRSMEWIAAELNYSSSTAGRRKDELVLNVALFMHWIK